MRFRKLRIAWSVVWGVVVVLAIGFWVRIFWISDIFGWQIGSTRLGVDFLRGSTILHYDDVTKRKVPLVVGHLAIPASGAILGKNKNEPFYGFRFHQNASGYSLIIPDWFTLTLSLGFAVAPWIRQLRYRFSLRTLLIATTLVAIVLGLIVWAAR